MHDYRCTPDECYEDCPRRDVSVNAYRDLVLKFISDLGYVSKDVAQVEIQSGVVWIHVFLRDEEGQVYLDKFGQVAKRTDKIIWREFAETSTGG
jgi:hypothetical protein